MRRARRYLPEELSDKDYYQPTDRGLEKKISEKLAYLRSLDDKQKGTCNELDCCCCRRRLGCHGPLCH